MDCIALFGRQVLNVDSRKVDDLLRAVYSRLLTLLTKLEMQESYGTSTFYVRRTPDSTDFATQTDFNEANRVASLLALGLKQSADDDSPKRRTIINACQSALSLAYWPS